MVRDEAKARLAAALGRQSDVRLAYLFGSVARGEERSRSDVDVAVLVEPAALGRPWPGIEATLLGDLCDALATERVDLVLLNVAPPVLAREVLRDGVVVLERDADERIAWELGALRRYADTRRLREIRTEGHRARQAALLR
ncbi:MAG: nucleotidyltransferase domain-containing protein [Myxococcota bacterium]